MFEVIDAIRITAKPVMSTYSVLELEVPVATDSTIGSRWVTFRFGESPFMPVARTTIRYWPGASVPALIVSETFVPEPDPGATDVDENEMAPIPVGIVLSGIASTERATFEPNDDEPTRLRLSDQVALLPSVGASDSQAGRRDREVALVIDPICRANGWYFTVRYGLPASPRTHVV